MAAGHRPKEGRKRAEQGGGTEAILKSYTLLPGRELSMELQWSVPADQLVHSRNPIELYSGKAMNLPLLQGDL